MHDHKHKLKKGTRINPEIALYPQRWLCVLFWFVFWIIATEKQFVDASL